MNRSYSAICIRDSTIEEVDWIVICCLIRNFATKIYHKCHLRYNQKGTLPEGHFVINNKIRRKDESWRAFRALNEGCEVHKLPLFFL